MNAPRLPGIWTRRLTTAVVLSCLLIGTVILARALNRASKPQDEAEPNGGLVVEEEYLDFGEGWENETLVHTISIKNPTAKQVEIHGFVSSCNCTSATPSHTVVPPGEAVEIRLSINLSERYFDGLGDGEAEFSVRVIPQLDDGKREQLGWDLHGRVRRVLTFEPSSLFLVEPIDHSWRAIRPTDHPASNA